MTLRRLTGAHDDPPKHAWPLRVLRRLLREALVPVILVAEAGYRFGRWLFRTEYVVEGGCRKRGACCHHILLEWSPFLDRHPWLGRLVLMKMTWLYSFYDKGYSWEVQDGLLVRVLGCTALRPDGRCGEHRLRPMLCRTYPEVPRFGRPRVLRGCGYEFRRRDGAPEPAELVQLGQASRLEPDFQVSKASPKPSSFSSSFHR